MKSRETDGHDGQPSGAETGGPRRLRLRDQSWAPSDTTWVAHTDIRNVAPTVHTLTRAEYMARYRNEPTTGEPPQ